MLVSLTGLGSTKMRGNWEGFCVYYGVESTLLSPQRTKGLDVRPHSTQFLRASPSLKKKITCLLFLGFGFCFYTLSYVKVRVRNLLTRNIDGQNIKYVFCIQGDPYL
jgi:hypothetical protein